MDIIDQLPGCIAAQYCLDASDLAGEAAVLKRIFASGNLDAPSFMREQVKKMVENFSVHFANAILEDAALRCRMLESVKRGSVERVDFLVETGEVVTDIGLTAIWSETQRTTLLHCCQTHGVQLRSHFATKSFSASSSQRVR